MDIKALKPINSVKKVDYILDQCKSLTYEDFLKLDIRRHINEKLTKKYFDAAVSKIVWKEKEKLSIPSVKFEEPFKLINNNKKRSIPKKQLSFKINNSVNISKKEHSSLINNFDKSDKSDKRERLLLESKIEEEIFNLNSTYSQIDIQKTEYLNRIKNNLNISNIANIRDKKEQIEKDIIALKKDDQFLFNTKANRLFKLETAISVYKWVIDSYDSYFTSTNAKKEVAKPSIKPILQEGKSNINSYNTSNNLEICSIMDFNFLDGSIRYKDYSLKELISYEGFNEIKTNFKQEYSYLYITLNSFSKTFLFHNSIQYKSLTDKLKHYANTKIAICPWDNIVFKNKSIIFYAPSSIRKKSNLKPLVLKNTSSKECFNYVKPYFKSKLPEIKIEYNKKEILRVISDKKLSDSILMITHESISPSICKNASSRHDSRPQCDFKSALNRPIENSLYEIKRYKSKFLNYLAEIQINDKLLIPAVECLSYSETQTTENSFIFTLECIDKNILKIVYENVNPQRSTVVFNVISSKYMESVRAIYNFFSSTEINKRSQIRYHYYDFEEHGILEYYSTNHDYFSEWKFRL